MQNTAAALGIDQGGIVGQEGNIVEREGSIVAVAVDGIPSLAIGKVGLGDMNRPGWDTMRGMVDQASA